MSQQNEAHHPASTIHILDEKLTRTSAQIASNPVSAIQVVEAAGRGAPDETFVLYRPRSEELRELREEENVLIEHVLDADFFVVPGDRLFRFQFGDHECQWPLAQISGRALYYIANVNSDATTIIHKTDEIETEVHPDQEVRLDRREIEHFVVRARGLEIFINDKSFRVSQDTLSGAQIKALGSIESDYQLFLEQPGDDKLIPDGHSVKLAEGMHFYSLPPATFG